MKRPVLFLIAALALASGAFALCFFGGSSLCVWRGAAQTNELAWLQKEFHLGDAEMKRIAVLHEGYKPVCEEMCVRLAAKRRELEQALKGSTNVTPDIERRLSDVATLRAECQATMLRHFQEVARSMPAEQGARYLAEMQNVTLGLNGREKQMVPMPAHHEHP